MNKIFRSTFLLLFSGLFIMLCFRARFAADDYFFMHLRESQGIWGGMVSQYFSFSGRWACHLVSNLLLTFSESSLFLPVFFIGTFVAFYFTLTALFYKIYIRTDVDERDFNSDYAPLYFIIGLIFTTRNIGEVWFWFISVTGYLWSIIAILVVCNILLGKKDSLLKRIIVIVCSIYIGGASESLAISFLIILLITGTYKFASNGRMEFLNSLFGKTWLLACGFLLTSLLISALAPGTSNRLELLPHVGFTGKIEVLMKSYVKVFSRYLVSYSPLLALFSIPWFTFGYYIQESRPILYKDMAKLAGKFTLAYLILLFIAIAPVAIILSESGPSRALFPVTLLSSAYFACIFAIIGMLFKHNTYVDKVTYIYFLIALTFVSFQLFKQYNSSLVFDMQYDERVQQIKAVANSDNPKYLEVSPLSDPGMLFNSEISTDTSFYVNQHWRMKYGVALKLIR